jgi:LacI family transcriptional regulator
LKKASLKTIASELGVSVSTVSKALRNSKEISKETRDKIQAFAKYLNYSPNKMALGLRHQKTMVIGIIVPEIVHHFFSSVISGLEEKANDAGYNVMIGLSNDQLQKEKELIKAFTNGSVDGLVISLSKESMQRKEYNHINDLIKQEFPLVFFDRAPEDLPVHKVLVDDFKGGYKATKHLLDHGVKYPCILSTPSHINVGQEREKGFVKALKDNGVMDYKIIHINEQYDIELQIAELFGQKKIPDGIFAVNELYASLALKEAQKRKISIPDQLKIIGFTNGVISRTTTPMLTTVDQHGKQMGQTAMNILLDCIQNTSNAKQATTFIIPTQIIKREST